MITVEYPRVDDRRVDKLYEAETARMIDEAFGDKPDNAHTFEALKDCEIALKHLRKTRDWLDEAMSEGIDQTLESKIGSFYEQIDDLVVDLMGDIEKWKNE